jgi:hypothetical protein
MHIKGESALDAVVAGQVASSSHDAEAVPAPVRHSSHSSSGRHHGHHRHGAHAQPSISPSQALHSPHSHKAFPHVIRVHRRPHRIGKVKYAWALIGGLAFFLAVFVLLFPPGSPPHVADLTGHLLLWPVLFLVLSGLFSLAVMFGFRLGSDPITRETALRHYVGRKLVKLGLVGALFNVGWLVGLFLAVLLSLHRG